MKNMLVHEALVDTIIRCLRAGSYISDDGSIELLKAVAVNSTEAERNALATSLSYGGVSGGGTFVSTGDMEFFIDSDNNNPTSPYTNYFRVNKGQQTVPVTDATHELFSVGSQSDPAGPVYCRIGPNLGLVGVGDDVPASLILGAGEVGGTAQAYGFLSCSSAVTALLSLGDIAFGTGVGKDIRISAGNEIKLSAGTTYSSTSDDLVFNYDDNYKNYQFKAADTGEEKTVFFNGSYEDSLIPPTKCLSFCLGGEPGTQNLDPRDLTIGYSGDPNYTTEATCMVVSPNVKERRAGFYVWNRITNTNLLDYTHLVNFHSSIDVDSIGNDKSRLFSVSAYAGINKEVFFSVRCDGSAYYTRAINHAQADIAEYFEIEDNKEDFEPGTVVKINAHGKVEPTTQGADPSVVGVVSTKPAMIMNEKEGDSKKTKVAIAMCGTVPVKCVIIPGNPAVEPGDLLVSSPYKGKACVHYKAVTEHGSPIFEEGTIIGKALERLEEVEGTIKMLILNR